MNKLMYVNIFITIFLVSGCIDYGTDTESKYTESEYRDAVRNFGIEEDTQEKIIPCDDVDYTRHTIRNRNGSYTITQAGETYVLTSEQYRIVRDTETFDSPDITIPSDPLLAEVIITGIG